MKKPPKSTKKRIDYAGLQKSLIRAVREQLPTTGKVGIAFSAGIDSGLVAFVVRKMHPSAKLLVVGTKDAVDFTRAETIARKWKTKLVKKVLSEEEIRKKYARAGKVLSTKDHLQCTIGVVNLAVAELAHEQGIKTLFVGSGADELFCGYAAFEAHRDSPTACESLRAEKVAGVGAHDVQREKICAEQYGVEVKAPFLEETFAARAMEIPAIENLRGKYGKLRKNALRMLAEKMRVPKAIVTAPKKAMQYGSGVAKRVNA